MGSRQALMYFDDTVATPSYTINIAPTVLTGYHGESVLEGVIGNTATGVFTIKVPGVYLALFNMSFTFSNGQPLEAHFYINDTVTPYGSHAWGLTSLRSNLSITAPLSLNKNDRVYVSIIAESDAQTLTIYDSQFVLVSI